jgi:serine-type D-Ala-D-Ala carboxypeptidase/endopeptidase
MAAGNMRLAGHQYEAAAVGVAMTRTQRAIRRIATCGAIAIRDLTFLAFAIGGLSTVCAQPVPALQGDFVSTLCPVHVTLHVFAIADGTFGSPDQGALGIRCSTSQVEGRTLSFLGPAAPGTSVGTIENDAATLTGTWSQSSPHLLTFTRAAFVTAIKLSLIDGFWLGRLQPDRLLRVQISITSDRAGQETCTVDSLDQDAFGLPCANVTSSGKDFSFDVPVAHGRWTGKLSSDGQVLTGTQWDGPQPLNLQRQASLIPPSRHPRNSFSPAIPAVDAAGMQAVLDRD